MLIDNYIFENNISLNSVRYYVDFNVSENSITREFMNKLILGYRNHKISTILVDDFSRIARSLYALEVFGKKVFPLDKVKTIKDDFNLSIPVAKEI